MNPVYNTLCAALEEAGVLTHDAAQKLARHMQTHIHQSDYEDALEMVKEVSRKVDNFADKTLHEAHEGLSKRVEQLESVASKVTKKSK